MGLRRAFAVAAIAWAALLPLATWAASRPHPSSLSYSFAFVVYGFGSFVCHQRPERSFHLWSMQMPVCARCAGIYAGGAFAALAVLLTRRKAAAEVVRPAADFDVDIRFAFVASALPTVATLLYEWTTGRMPSGAIRGISGAVVGAMVAWIVMVRGVNYRPVRATAAEQTQTGGLVLLCLASWAIPGAGHLWLGRRSKGLVFLIALPLMFAIGLAVHGRLFPFDMSEPLVGLAAIADLGIGAVYGIASALGYGAGDVRAVTYEYGNAFLIVAGLLNLLVVIDACDIALGRK